MSMRMCFFNIYEPVSPIFRDLLPYLAKQGFNSEVVISQTEYRSARESIANALGSEVRVIQIPSGLRDVRGAFQKLWVIFTYLVGAAFHSLFSPKADLNIFLTQPPLFGLWGLILKRLRSQPYACIVMDIYPDVAIQSGLLKANSISARFMARLNHLMLRRASIVIVIGRCMADYMRTIGVNTTNIHFVPNWVNQHAVQPVIPSQNQLRKSLGLEKTFVIQYSGNMGLAHFFDDLLEIARRWRERADVRFVIIGDGPRRREVETFCAAHGLNNVLFLPFQPPEKLSESMSLGDVHFVSLRSGFGGLMVPSKAYAALAAGRPILYQGEASDEIAQMISEEKIGMVIPIGASSALENAIQWYIANQHSLAEQSQRALALARGRYGVDAAMNTYRNVFIEIEKTLI